MSKMFSAQANPYSLPPCLPAAEGHARARARTHTHTHSLSVSSTHTPAGSTAPCPRISPGAAKENLTARYSANRASRGSGASGALAMYAMHRRSMQTSNSDIHFSPRPLALLAGSALCPKRLSKRREARFIASSHALPRAPRFADAKRRHRDSGGIRVDGVHAFMCTRLQPRLLLTAIHC